MALVNKTQEIIGLAQGLCQKWSRQRQVFCKVGKFIQVHDFNVFVRIDQYINKEIVENVCIFLRTVLCLDNISIPVYKIVLGIKDLADLKAVLHIIHRNTVVNIFARFQNIPFGHKNIVIPIKDQIVF